MKWLKLIVILAAILTIIPLTPTNHAANFSSSSETVLASSQSGPYMLAVYGGYVYWTNRDGNTICKVSASGGDVTVLASGLLSPTGIAVDANYVYWVERSGHFIKKVPVGGGSVTTLASGLGGPFDLKLYGSYLYFTQYDAGKISKISVEGGNITDLAILGHAGAYTLAVDGTSVYFIDRTAPGTATVGSVSVDGGTVTYLATGVHSPADIAVDESYVYWTDSLGGTGTGKILRVPKGGGSTVVLVDRVNKPWGISLDNTSLYFTRNEASSTSEYHNTGSVTKVSKSGGKTTDLVNNIALPFDVVVDGGYAYWTEYRSTGRTCKIDVTSAVVGTLTVYGRWYNGTWATGAQLTVSDFANIWNETQIIGPSGYATFSLSQANYGITAVINSLYFSAKYCFKTSATIAVRFGTENQTTGETIESPLADGVWHSQIMRTLPQNDAHYPGYPNMINILRVNISDSNVKVAPALAGGKLGVSKKVSEIAKEHGALAAVNAPYFFGATILGIVKIDGVLYSDPQYNRSALAITYNKTAVVTNIASSSDPQLANYEQVIGGGPRLVKNGEICVTGKEENFFHDITLGGAYGRNPRTAVGLTADNQLIIVTVDGRQTAWSVGLGLTELAQLLIEMGAVEAFNLDGGGSTTCVVRNTLVNKPSDGTERLMPAALLIYAQTNYSVVTTRELNHGIQMKSNSTLYWFDYDPSLWKMKYSVGGAIGTQGFCNITIPKEIIPNPQVLVNSQPIAFTLMQNDTHYLLDFTYTHTLIRNEVIISSRPPIPEIELTLDYLTSVYINENVTVSVTVENIGTANATAVEVEILPSAGLSLLNASATFDVGMLGIGQEATLVYLVRASEAGNYTVTVTVTFWNGTGFEEITETGPEISVSEKPGIPLIVYVAIALVVIVVIAAVVYLIIRRRPSV